jgi:DNA-3-methyladenine glycosylase II
MVRMETLEFELLPVPPFRLDLTAWALRRRQSNMIDQFDGAKYRRAILVNGKVLAVSVIQSDSLDRPLLSVEVCGNHLSSVESDIARKNLELLLGVNIDLSSFYKLARHNAKVWDIASRFRGVKPPKFESIFEALLNAISCQQVSLAVGLILLNRLARKYGRMSPETNSLYALPTPKDLATLKPNSLRKLGFSWQKSQYVIGLAKLIVDREVKLERLSDMTDDDALDYLQKIPGVGRWSAQYVLLRGLGRLHRFPIDDVGAQNGLKQLLNLRKRPDDKRTSELIASWQPYAGVMYFHLLLSRLEKEGYLAPKNLKC